MNLTKFQNPKIHSSVLLLTWCRPKVTPIVTTNSCGRVSASNALTLMNVKTFAPSTPAQCMRIIATLAETACFLHHCEQLLWKSQSNEEPTLPLWKRKFYHFDSFSNASNATTMGYWQRAWECKSFSYDFRIFREPSILYSQYRCLCDENFSMTRNWQIEWNLMKWEGWKTWASSSWTFFGQILVNLDTFSL